METNWENWDLNMVAERTIGGEISITNPLVILLLLPIGGIICILLTEIPGFRAKAQSTPHSGGQENKAEVERGSGSFEGATLHAHQGSILRPSGQSERKDELVKRIGLITSLITFIVSLYIWLTFDYSTNEFQNLFQLNWVETVGPWRGYKGLNLVFGIDGLGLIFIVLTTLLIPLCILISWNTITYLHSTYIISFLILEFLLIGVFSVLDLIGFYIFFEGILIPMFLIIGIWGSREQKINAAYYFFFYTLLGSVLMLISIFYIYSKTGTTDYLSLIGILQNLPLEQTTGENLSEGETQRAFSIFTPTAEKLIFLAFFSSFAVKIPKYPFHIWLPQAHVEAPVAGSVLLAGILIKLGSYGFIRYTLPLLPGASVYFAPLIYTLSILAIIYASLTTIRQTDLKRVIAYSSVGHMGLVSIGIFTFTNEGLQGSIFLQIAHGLVSSALFIIVTILYDRYHTRLIKYYRGVTMVMPIFSLLFLVFTLANIGVPLSCNFIGEFMCLYSIFTIGGLTIAILSGLGVILSACYALFLYNRVAFGAFSPYLSIENKTQDLQKNSPKTRFEMKNPGEQMEKSSPDSTTNIMSEETFELKRGLIPIANRDINRREFFVLLPLAVLTLLTGLFPNIVFDLTQNSVTQISVAVLGA